MVLNKASNFVAPIAGLAIAIAALSPVLVNGAPRQAAPGDAAGPPPHAAQRGPRGDADGDKIADALAAKLLAAAPGEFFDVIVVFDGPRAADRAREVAGPFQIEREFSIIHGFQAKMPAARIWALTNAPGLVSVHENGQVRALDLPSNDDTGVTLARATHSVDGTNVTVCILDTGINPNHEMFDTRVFGPGDFMDFTPTGNASPYDDQGHGSHVAGILAGDGVGAENVIAPQAAGVAPGVNLKIGKVLDASGSGPDSQVIAGIEWCTGLADIISMSLGGNPTDGSDPMSVAVNCAADPDYSPSCGNANAAIVVVSAGNSGAEEGTIGTPGAAINAITVGSFAEWSGDPALDWQDDGVYPNPFSSRGPVFGAGGVPLWIKPDIMGPGSRVLSAYINDPEPINQLEDIYAVADGTSMSTPFVAAVIALMLEADPSLGVWDPGGADPRLPHEKVRDILALTSFDVGAPGKDNEYGYGLVDAMAAVSEALGSPIGATEYPLQAPVSASVANFGNWTHEFTVSQDYVDQQLPIAAHITIEGQCTNLFFGTCAAGWSYWDPDLELIVERNTGGANWQQVPADLRPSGIGEVTKSECPAFGECWNSVGRVEVVHFIPNVAGDYRMRVWPSLDPSTNNGKGGDFSFELSMFTTLPDGNATPNAAFTYGCTNVVCDFADATTDDGTIVSWSWDFGDGNTSTDQNPTHDFGASGDYTVELTVIDDGGKSDVTSQLVSVSWPPPVASFMYDCTDLSCDFTDTSTSDIAIVSRSWEFGDGNTSPVQNPSYNYGAAGDYTVTLTVEDEDGASDMTSQIVSVTAGNPPPVADFDSSCTFLDCDFTDQSTDDGSVVAWSWTFGDGGSSNAQNPSHSYAGAGTYAVTLVATDNNGEDDSVVKNVNVSAPPAATMHVGDLDGFSTPADRNRWDATVVVNVELSDETPVEGATVNGSWSAGANGGGNCVTVADGTCSITKNNNKGNVSSVAFTVTSVTGAGASYDAAANHDPDGDSDGTAIAILKDGGPPPPNQPPNASFADNCAGLACTFTDSSTDDGNIIAWSWDFGDGNGSTDQNPPQHVYAAVGTYTVSLTVTDDDLVDDTSVRQITVTAGGGGGITLSVSTYKVKGVQHADLTWSGATSASVDVKRDGNPLVPVPPETDDNDGEYTDNIGAKGGGSYVYEVCEAGTTTCSNTVNAVF